MTEASAAIPVEPGGARFVSAAAQLLRDELTVTPERWSRMLRMTALAAAVVILSNALRVPGVGISAYMIFFFQKSDVVTTVRTGIAAVVALVLAIAAALILYSATLGQPSLRLFAMGCVIFAGFYVVRASRLGPLGFLIGFLGPYALTFADSEVSPERLTRELLWLWVAISYPIALIVASDLLLGHKPEELFRQGVAARLSTAAAVLVPHRADVRASREFERLERMGTAEIAPYVNSQPSALVGTRGRLLAHVDLLILLLRELPEAARNMPAVAEALDAAGQACRNVSAKLVERGGTSKELSLPQESDLARRTDVPAGVLAVVLPLLSCVREIASSVAELRSPHAPSPNPAASMPAAHGEAAAPPDKTEAVHFAIKVTLASMTGYILFRSLDWTGIHTAMLTCLFVAQDSTGATIHKLTLRIVGAVVGAAIGIASIVFVLPELETVGGLAVLVAAVTLLAAWFGTASQRISYAGWQMALAFYLTVLQGFSRTSKMVVGRDRVIGILIGNVIMSIVFTTIWPVRVKAAARRALGRAVQSLADALRGKPDRLPETELAFRAEIEKVKQSATLQGFESRDAAPLPSVDAIESLFIPIHALHHPALETGALSREDGAVLASASEGAARWLSELATAIPALEPAPPFHADEALSAIDDHPGARLQASWLELLDDRISRIAADRQTGAAEPPP